MASPQALKSLLLELRRVRSPLTRMKLVARAWRTVRELSPQERQEIASELGVQGLEGLLERLGQKHDGIAPADVLRALSKVEDDPAKLGALVRGLRDPSRRKELIRSGVGALNRLLEEDAEATTEEAAPPPAAAAEVRRDETPEVVVAREIIVVQPQSAPSPSDEDPSSDSTDLDVPPAAEVSPPWIGSSTEPAVVAAPALAPAARPSAAPAFSRGKLAEISTLTRRFRALRELLSDAGRLRGLPPEEAADAFPDGWPRRRAICMLLRAGLPAITDDAVALVGRLSRPVDRRWCVLALVDSRKLSAAEAARLRREFPFPAVSRRLRRS